MTHRFPLKEIARQSGLGTATIDRVLHNRSNVSPQTKMRVMAAIEELEQQETQLSARGRRLFVDFVIEAPSRFSQEVKRAAEDVLPQIGTAVCRPRFIMQENMTDAEVKGILGRISKRGSQGVCLKLRNTPEIRSSVKQLIAQGIPVVTLVTDMNHTDRTAYVGLDNAGAGRTAAYLISKMVKNQTGQVLATRSNERFLGEEERETSFATVLSETNPELEIVSVTGGGGGNFETSKVISAVVDKLTELRAVYSMGGGNRAILEMLAHHGLAPEIFIAHDLDRDNCKLMTEGHLDFILHHDLHADMQNVYNALLMHHGLFSDPSFSPISDIQIITPENMPSPMI